jgi:hypothetical protein
VLKIMTPGAKIGYKNKQKTRRTPEESGGITKETQETTLG